MPKQNNTLIEQLLKAVTSNSEDIEAMKIDIKELKQGLIKVNIELFNINKHIRDIDERTAYLPKLYDIMDSFMREIKESRSEFPIISSKLKNHETRIENLEKKQTNIKVISSKSKL